MPVDEAGNRADVVMDPNSTISRAIPGRYLEQYTNAASRDVYKKLWSELVTAPATEYYEFESQLRSQPQAKVDAAFDYLLGYYRVISPVMASWFDSGQIGSDYETRLQYLAGVLSKGRETKVLGIYRPSHDESITQDLIHQVEQTVYRPVYGPVSYIGNSGKRCVTKNNVRIGQLYFMVLEKIGDDWAAVSSCKTQHFGVIAQLGKNDKFSKPIRQQGPRGMGEAEVRNAVSYIGPRWVAEMMDRNNNPVTHRAMCESLLTVDNPSNIDNLVDRTQIPYGGNQPLMMLKHLVEVSGARFVDQPFNPRQAGL